MTKEEIYDDATFKNLGNNPNGTRMDVVYASMDEYAKQQCIAYAHWLFKRLLPHMTPPEAPEVEAENLYNKFLTETSI